MANHKITAGQLKDEPMQDFIKFLVFLDLGPSRTLSEAYNKYYEYNASHEVSPVWQRLMEKYRWAERVSEYEKVQSSRQKETETAKSKH